MKTQVMAIGNVTPDSFYASSRLKDTDSVIRWAHQALAEGADILDIGACSTRPNSTPVSADEEWRRLEPALTALRKELPEASLSLDTFRTEIARQALEHFGPMIINDISGGNETMYELASQWDTPYVFCMRGDYKRLSVLDHTAVTNWILDPGFGFCGGVQQDYECLRQMNCLRYYHLPVLVGVSRKSMVYKPLGLTPETCLSATQALQLYALEHGATILRTHDVKETEQIVRLFDMLNS